jgi:hypothetical protein
MTWNRVQSASCSLNSFGALPIFTGLTKLACCQVTFVEEVRLLRCSPQSITAWGHIPSANRDI